MYDIIGMLIERHIVHSLLKPVYSIHFVGAAVRIRKLFSNSSSVCACEHAVHAKEDSNGMHLEEPIL